MRVVINARDALGVHRSGIGRYGINLLETLIAQFASSFKALTILVSREDMDRDERVRGLADGTKKDTMSFEGHSIRFMVSDTSSTASKLAHDHLRDPEKNLDVGHQIYHSLKFVLPWFRSRTRGFKRAVTIHDLLFLDMPELFPGKVRLYWGRFVKRSVSMADIVLVPSEYTKERILYYYGRENWEKCRVIPHGIDPVFMNEGEEDGKEALVAKISLCKDEPYFLCVGNLEPRKNLRTIIEAWNRYRSLFNENPPLLVWAGQECWEDTEVLKAAVRNGNSGRIRLVGFLSDSELAGLYRNASGFLFPSLGEGFGLPVLEAMASGCPVIHSGKGALSEVAGDGQIRVDPENPAEIARNVKRLMEDPDAAREMRDAGMRKAREFSWAVSARDLVETYRSLLDIEEKGD